MDSTTYKILTRDVLKSQVLFSVNDDIQIIFRTDENTADKLEDDEALKYYLRAVIQEKVLSCYGIEDSKQIKTLARLEVVDESKTIVSLGIAPTKLEQGVEELHCFIIDERLLLDNEEEPITVDDASASWGRNQQVPEVTGPTLRWTSDMTSLLIQIRGEMDREFNRAKYKFRLWEQVAAKLNSILLTIRVSAKDCDDKWRNIVATYRKNIDKIKTFGDNSVRWEYFNAMDNILKGTKDLTDSNENSSEQMAKLICELNQSMGHSQPSYTRMTADGVEIIDVNAGPVSDEDVNSADDEESSHNYVITRKFTNEKRRWTTEMCLTLLFLRTKAESKFQENFDKVHLWRDLAGEMNEKFLTDFNADEVESVWKYCVMTYDTNLENLKSRGVNTVKWKYFAVMDELRGGTSEITDICVPRPGEKLLKKFHKIKAAYINVFEPSILPDNDVLCFTAGNSVTESMKDSDSEDATFTMNSTLWTKDMVKTLIFLKKQINEELSCNKISRKKQWVTMVRRFRELKNIKVSEEACEDKWRNLLRTYKKNLLRVKNRGATVKWPFFWQMRDIVGNTVLLDSDKRLSNDSSAASRLSGGPSTSIKHPPSVGVGDEFEEDMLEDRTHIQLDTLLTTVNDLRYNQSRIMYEMDAQKKVLQEIQKDQINIKCLLTQLLQKFT